MGSEERLPVYHSLYGLRIAANIPVPALPIQCESGQIDIRIHLKEQYQSAPVFSAASGDFFYISSKSEPDDECVLRVAMLDGGGFGFFYSDGARFAVDPRGREVWADWPDDYTLEDACTYLVGPVIAFVLRLRGIVCLHASAMAVDGRAICLMGCSGAGKSTTAAAFAQLGYPVLSDDVTSLDDQGSRFLVQPGYPRINLWPDSVRILFGAEEALPHITPTWGKRYMPLDQTRFQATPLPLGAVYVLGEHEPGLTAPIVEELSANEAFITMVSNTYVNYLLNAEMRSREFGVLGRIVAELPVRRVRLSADSSKLSALCEAIAWDAKRTECGYSSPRIDEGGLNVFLDRLRGHDLGHDSHRSISGGAP